MLEHLAVDRHGSESALCLLDHENFSSLVPHVSEGRTHNCKRHGHVQQSNYDCNRSQNLAKLRFGADVSVPDSRDGDHCKPHTLRDGSEIPVVAWSVRSVVVQLVLNEPHQGPQAEGEQEKQEERHGELGNGDLQRSHKQGKPIEISGYLQKPQSRSQRRNKLESGELTHILTHQRDVERHHREQIHNVVEVLLSDLPPLREEKVTATLGDEEAEHNLHGEDNVKDFLRIIKKTFAPLLLVVGTLEDRNGYGHENCESNQNHDQPSSNRRGRLL
mmetsp:Transcript_34485/g.75448  ORF Transcript_34485/g.75448 Transcript_34485/m.75448 type:complete len:274 (+) Transcript_34485:376-1197(+)